MVVRDEVGVRERRQRRRSRLGCRNCKLRKLKCDECKPQCKRCCSFGLICNFMPRIPDLQPVADDTIRRVHVKSVHPRHSLSNAVWTSDPSASYHYQLNTKCQDFVTRYLEKGHLSANDPKMVNVNRQLLALAFEHPFLMHASLAVAFAYDRHVNNFSRRTLDECYHSSQGTALFNKRLRQSIGPTDKDPIWGTAAALAIVSFCSPDPSTPEESWPLDASRSADLEWLRLSRGKMSLWTMVNPLRRDSLFQIMAPVFAELLSPLPDSGIDGIDEDLAVLCQLHETSTAGMNPYLRAAHAVSQIYNLPDNEVTIGLTELFTRSIDGVFEGLLLEKDPIALLLLYLWYQKASRSVWWVGLRARVEAPAILSYLRLNHPGHDTVQSFLPPSYR